MRTPDTYHSAGIRRGTATSNFHAQRDNLVLGGALDYPFTALGLGVIVIWPEEKAAGRASEWKPMSDS